MAEERVPMTRSGYERLQDELKQLKFVDRHEVIAAIEEARSYKSLLDKGYLTQDQLAKRMGLSQPSVANKLRLLNLDEEVQEALLADDRVDNVKVENMTIIGKSSLSLKVTVDTFWGVVKAKTEVEF